MSIVTIPVIAAQNGGALYTLVDDLTNLNSQVSRIRDNGNLIIDDSGAEPEQKIQIDEAVLLSILDNGGNTEDYLFGIRQPSASANIDVPVGVPSRLFKLGEVKTFARWFAENAELWLNTVTDEIIYYNSPNPSDGLILTSSESELIRQIDDQNYSFMTVAEVQAEVAGPNWTKL